MSGDESPGGRVPGRRRRAGRSPGAPSGGPPADTEPVRDDTDVGWGDDAGVAASESEDDRWLRDRPPHWG